MKETEVFEVIKKYFIDEFEIAEEKIILEANLFTDLELDSIDALDMVGMLEAEIDVEIDEDELKEIKTIQNVIDYVLKQTGS